MPTLPESEATGPAAALYADIREVMGVPVVNLIWRRLAFFPGALEWAWGAVRPLYAGGAADAAAAEIRARTPLPDLPPWPSEMLSSAGPRRCRLRGGPARAGELRPRQPAEPRCARRAAAGAGGRARAAGPAPASGNGAGPAVEGRLPPIPAMESLAPAVRELVLRLNGLGNSGDDVVASLYRHLAYWPGYLALVWVQLAALDGDGRLRITISAGADAAREASAGLAAGLELPPEPAPPAVAEAVGQFVRGPIARMTPVSLLLLHLLRRG